MYDIIAVSNRRLVQGDYFSQIERIVSGGIRKVLLREKDVSLDEYLRLAEKVMGICEKYDAVCILHTFEEAAKKLGAEWFHLPLWAAQHRKENCRGIYRLGISAHSLEQVKAAEQCQAEYVTLGHVFATECKPGLPPLGTAFLGDICRNTQLPVYAIGGITPWNAAQCMEAGAAGICIMSWCMQAGEKEIKKLCETEA